MTESGRNGAQGGWSPGPFLARLPIPPLSFAPVTPLDTPQSGTSRPAQGRPDTLGQYLVSQQILTAPQLELALREQKRLGESLGSALVRLRFTSEERLADAMAGVLGLRRVELKDTKIDATLFRDIPREFARKHCFIPIERRGRVLEIAMSDPFDVVGADTIQETTGSILKIHVATESEIREILNAAVSSKDNTQRKIEKIIDRALGEESSASNTEEGSFGAAIIELVDTTVSMGAAEGATDIHIEPEESLLRVRYRIDGILHQGFVCPSKLQNAFISRVKVLSDLDISERRLPQDGRFQVDLETKQVDIRVSIMPSAFGENIVMRLLDKNAALLDLTSLGFPDDIKKNILDLLDCPYGIFLVTGPTGSGKSTTLYASLSSVNSMEKKVVTVEDPIEYQMPLIRQSQVNAQVGFTFASGLRAILRQDPDILMVGEIRDLETAQIAIRAGLTGHLVLSTLHTNTAAGAFSRLGDMGVDTFLINSSLLGVLAQRLVRRLCVKCRQEKTPDGDDIAFFARYGMPKPELLYEGRGCIHCRETGYKGRMGIYEIFMPTPESRKILQTGGGENELLECATNAGMKFMIHDGLNKATLGVTTVEELQRVLLTHGH